MTISLNKRFLALNKTFEKIKKNKIFMSVMLVLGVITIFAAASKTADIGSAQGIFAEVTGGGAGGGGNFLKSILDGIKWIVFWGIIIFSLVQFFAKGSRDFNLSEFIVHLVVTVIIAWLGANFADIIKKAAGAEVDTNTKQFVSVTDNVNTVPEDIVEYVTPLGIIKQ